MKNIRFQWCLPLNTTENERGMSSAGAAACNENRLKGGSANRLILNFAGSKYILSHKSHPPSL
jgi:hypothetical protein